jgi:hypothetical protein
MTKKMNPEVKARWVAALRSGEYEQTTDFLKDKDGHCCLGVLCDLYARESGMKAWSEQDLGDVDGITIDGGDKGLPGAVVAIWSGLDVTQRVEIDGERSTLFAHNDDGKSFEQIAKAIEAQL